MDVLIIQVEWGHISRMLPLSYYLTEVIHDPQAPIPHADAPNLDLHLNPDLRHVGHYSSDRALVHIQLYYVQFHRFRKEQIQL